MHSNWSYCPETLNSGHNQQIFVPCDLEIWWMTMKNNRAHLLCCSKLCASFHNHGWIWTKVTVRKRSIWVKTGDFLSHVTLKFDGWPWKTIGHIFYVASSFVHFHSHRWIQTKVTVWKRSIRVKIADFFVPCDLEIGRMTLKNNRAPFQCCFKLYAAFRSHRWIKTKVTVRKRSIRVKIADFLSLVTLKFDGWPWKQ